MASAEHSQDLDAPKSIKLGELVVDVCFHPEKDVIAGGCIDGNISIYSYSTSEQNHELMTLTHHKKACRALRFSQGGDQLYTASKDKSLQAVDMNTGTVIRCVKKAHESPLYSLLVIDENVVATGDDDGTLKVWDKRQGKAVMEMKETEEFISDLGIDSQKKILLATSGDGTLTAFNIKKRQMEMQSELFDSELLSLAIIKGGEKVLCGNGEGIINIFNWGQWGNISDRFPGHPMSVDCMVALNQDIVFTGSMDGKIRAVNILPNRFLGTVGEHEEFPVENMSISRDKIFLASCSHDQQIKFWNVSEVKNEKVDTSKRQKKTQKNRTLNKAAAKNDFFADLAEDEKNDKATEKHNEDDDDDDDDDSDTDDES